MSGNHSPTPWRAEVYRPAFAEVVDAEGHVVVASVFKNDAEFIVRAVNAYTQVSRDFGDAMRYRAEVERPRICGVDLAGDRRQAGRRRRSRCADGRS